MRDGSNPRRDAEGVDGSSIATFRTADSAGVVAR